MNEPLISIVIPCYNIEAYIDRTLHSVFGQTYPNLEVIAVDDGSQDGTGAVLDRYAEMEPRLHVLHQKNQGVSYARLNGVAVSSGEYIGFVDGDDLVDPDMYERLYQNAAQYRADISHCGYRVITKNKVLYFNNTGIKKEQSSQLGVIDLLTGTEIVPGLCCKLYKRILFDPILAKQTAFDPSLRLNEDLMLNYFLFRNAKKSIYEDFCPYQYVKRENSASQSDSRLIDFEHPIRVRQIIYRDCIGTEEEKLAERIYISKTLHKISEIYDKNDTEFRLFRDEMIGIVKQYKNVIGDLTLKQKINGFLLLYNPSLYRIVNRFYRSIR